jgi:hypothetical protein
VAAVDVKHYIGTKEQSMIFACQHCGGTLEPAIIAGALAGWGYGCYLLRRLWQHWRKK